MIMLVGLANNLSARSNYVVPEEIFVSESDSNQENHELSSVIENFQESKPQIVQKEVGPLNISREDIRLEKSKEGSYIDLVIRKKSYINSVLLTNYYWDHDNTHVREYGLRSLSYNSVNGDEKRLYKKTFIGKNQGLYFLVDSTPETDSQFGSAFRIRIPDYIVYGYRKNGEVYGILRIKDGLRLNIRTFARKYSDYKGEFRDNPISLVLRARPLDIKSHPSITKIKELLDEEYMGVYVQYDSKSQFFKNFLMREESERNFTEISFSKGMKGHRKAVLLEAFYKGNEGRYLRAIIYIKRESIPKTYYITAIDKNGVHSVGRIQVKVPAIDGDRGETHYEDVDEGEYWYNEGDFSR